jgi:hypothetical protein
MTRKYYTVEYSQNKRWFTMIGYSAETIGDARNFIIASRVMGKRCGVVTSEKMRIIKVVKTVVK